MGRRSREALAVTPEDITKLNPPDNYAHNLYHRWGGITNAGIPGAFDKSATRNCAPCPLCGGDVRLVRHYHPSEKHTNAQGKTRAVVVIYGQCATHGRHDTWGTRRDDSTPPPPPKASAPKASDVPPVETKKDSKHMGLEAAIKEIINETVEVRLKALETQGGNVDEAKVLEIALKALESSRKVEITVPSMPEVKFEGRAHPLLARVLRYIAAGSKRFYIWGKAGAGKSTLGAQVAEALKRPCTTVAMSEMTPVENITGYDNVLKGKYVPSAVVKAWTSGHVLLVDEADAQNANTALAWNGIEQGIIYTPDGPKTAHPDTVIICTANTAGSGASRTYNGRNALDGAFMDRFRVLHAAYDKALEIAICGGDTHATRAVEAIIKARERADSTNSQKMLTSRMARRAAEDMRLDGISALEAFRLQADDMGWSETEKQVFA